MDDRLAQGLPLYGTYIAAGEPAGRLTLAELNKFDTYPFVKRIYDNGPIQVYDTTELLHPSARAAPAGAPAGGTGLDVGVFALAAVVAVLWLLRLRRRSGPVHDVEHLVVCGVVGALVIGVFGAFVVRATRAPPEAVAIGVLLVLLVLSLRPEKGYPRQWAAFRRTNGRAVSLEATARFSDLPDDSANEAKFYERREVKSILAYLRVLADPDDDVSARRIVNVPKRGIGDASVYGLAAWARANHVSFSEAIDRAAEAGLTGKALRGTEQLSETLAELRPLARTVNPADFVQLVADRTGYRDELAAEQSREAAGRMENLAELATRAGHFDDVTRFLEAVALVEGADELDPAPTLASSSNGGRPDSASSAPAPIRTRRSRPQVVLGCVGLAFFALGATVATRAALKDWTPPPELSITTSATGHSVADVQLGSAGPIDRDARDHDWWQDGLALQPRTDHRRPERRPARRARSTRVHSCCSSRVTTPCARSTADPPATVSRARRELRRPGRLPRPPASANGCSTTPSSSSTSRCGTFGAGRTSPRRESARTGSLTGKNSAARKAPYTAMGGAETNRGRGFPKLAAKLVSRAVNGTGSG